MSEASPRADAPEPPRRPRWQVSLRTLVLLTAALAAWMTYYVNRRQIPLLEARIGVLRPLARELDVADPTKVAVVKLEELWYDENKWDLYLPEGRYRLNLATRGVDQQGLAPVVKSAPIGPGRHLLAIEQEWTTSGARVVVTWDRTGRLEVDESREWDPGRGSTGGGQFSTSTQLDPNEPVVLFRRIFTRPDAQGNYRSPDGPAEGILLWIEAESEPAESP